jgi:hypothetical protein
LYAVLRNFPLFKSPSTCLSWKVLQDLGVIFDEALEVRDRVKGSGWKRGYSGDKIRREEKSGTKEEFKLKVKRAEEMDV